MAYTHRVFEFYGDPINFFINEEKVLIGMRSVSKSIGIPWVTQFRKIKSQFEGHFKIETIRNQTHYYQALCLNRSAVKKYLASIDKAPSENKLKLYQKEFPQFSYDQIAIESQVEREDNYLGSIKGIEQLIYDAVIKLGNEKAITQLATTLFPLLSQSIISNENLSVLNPIYDIAEKTADRQNELNKHKSTSISQQLESVAEKIRDIDRKSSLEIRRIAKSVY